MAYFLAEDADGVPTIWHGTPGGEFLRPMPALTINDIRPGFRDDVWPKIVAALTEADATPDELVETANVLSDPETMAAIAEARQS